MGYPSFDRNRQPMLPGKSARVQGQGLFTSDETEQARQAVEAACVRFGELYAHWRRYTPDWNVGPCPRHNVEESGRAATPDCPICFGTGWRGGYSRPSVQRMIINDTEEQFRFTEAGFMRLQRGDSISPAVPNVQQDDVLAHVGSRNGRWETGQRYLIQPNVNNVRFTGEELFMRTNIDDHLDPVPEVVGYKFQVTMVDSADAREEFRNVLHRIPFENPVWLAELTSERP